VGEPNNDIDIEPAEDLDNPQPKNKRYERKDLLLESMVRKENHGFRIPRLFLLNLPRVKMRKTLITLLKFLDLLFYVLA
jgi:hypothetical protein